MIRVGTRYGIDVLPDQYAVIEFRTAQKGKNIGEEQQKTIGYFYALSGALRAIRDDMVRHSLADGDMNLYEAINTIKQVDDDFWKTAKETCGEV